MAAVVVIGGASGAGVQRTELVLQAVPESQTGANCTASLRAGRGLMAECTLRRGVSAARLQLGVPARRHAFLPRSCRQASLVSGITCGTITKLAAEARRQ